jgi:hypothetical protein
MLIILRQTEDFAARSKGVKITAKNSKNNPRGGTASFPQPDKNFTWGNQNNSDK